MLYCIDWIFFNVILMRGYPYTIVI